MGTYASLFKERKSMIPEDKKEEFVSKVEKVFCDGGMMDMKLMRLFDKNIYTIQKASMQLDGMNVYYNYFEDDLWENAGFDIDKCCVWSNKIGWRQFYRVVVAAYVLEAQYTEGASMVMINGEPVGTGVFVGWLNYLFGERNDIKDNDLWKLFEEIHSDVNKDEGSIRWEDMGNRGYAFIGGCEIYAVLNGYEKALERYASKEKEKNEELALEYMLCFAGKLKEYMKNNDMDKEGQLQQLMKIIHRYYETDKVTIGELYSKDETYYELIYALVRSDAPAFAVKVIAEEYGKDFWELWGQIQGVAKRKITALYENDMYYIVPISTEQFFGQSADDMIIYWEEGCELEFSNELKDWFRELRVQYDDLLNEKISIDKMMFYIVELLEEANENYYNIYAFTGFVEETLENMQDKRYQVLWKIFDNMIRDPEMIEIGNVIFVPDEPKRRLTSSWCVMEWSKKNNKARMILRRYMALMGNKEMRCKIFGF